MVSGDVETEEGVPPPWIRMVKRSSFADHRHGGDGEEGGGLAPPWVRMVKRKQEVRSKPGMDKLRLLRGESIQEKRIGERARRAGWTRTRTGGLGSYKPGLWGMAAIRSLLK